MPMKLQIHYLGSEPYINYKGQYDRALNYLNQSLQFAC